MCVVVSLLMCTSYTDTTVAWQGVDHDYVNALMMSRSLTNLTLIHLPYTRRWCEIIKTFDMTDLNTSSP